MFQIYIRSFFTTGCRFKGRFTSILKGQGLRHKIDLSQRCHLVFISLLEEVSNLKWTTTLRNWTRNARNALEFFTCIELFRIPYKSWGAKSQTTRAPLTPHIPSCTHRELQLWYQKMCIQKTRNCFKFQKCTPKNKCFKKTRQVIPRYFLLGWTPPAGGWNSPPHGFQTRVVVLPHNCCQAWLRPGPTLFRSIPVRECQVFLDLYFFGGLVFL